LSGSARYGFRFLDDYGAVLVLEAFEHAGGEQSLAR